MTFKCILLSSAIFLCSCACGLSAQTQNIDTPKLEQRNFVNTTDDQIEKINWLHKRARIYVKYKKFDKAISTYLDIIFTEPDDDVAYTNLGFVYLAINQFEKAENAFEHALHIYPENSVAKAGLQNIKDPDGPMDIQSVLDQYNEENLD